MSEKTTIAKVKSLVLHGRDAVEVVVEVMVSEPGIGIHLVGLPDREVKESLLRVVTALQSAGFSVPGAKVVINIAPSVTGPRFVGSSAGLDAAIAVAILEASGETGNSFFSDTPSKYVLGELGLDGSLRAVPGTVPFLLKTASESGSMLFIPSSTTFDGWNEVSDGDGVDVVSVSSITDLVACSRNHFILDSRRFSAAVNRQL